MRPGMIRTIQIGFTILDRASTVIDPDFRAPVSAPAYLPEIQVPGLVRYIKKEGFNQKSGGDEPLADGHVMVWQDVLATLSLYPMKGDLITAVAGEVVKWLIIEVRTQVHIGGSAQAKLFYFKRKLGE